MYDADSLDFDIYEMRTMVVKILTNDDDNDFSMIIHTKNDEKGQ